MSTSDDIRAVIFDYGGTLDTNGTHWGRMIYHAYKRVGLPVSFDEYQKAYVYAERSLSNYGYVKPEDSFYTTLKTKLQLQLEFLVRENSVNVAQMDEFDALDVELPTNAGQCSGFVSAMLDDLYDKVNMNIDKARGVLQHLRSKYPLALVSNFYGNLDAVLREFDIDRFFDTVVESAKVGIRKPDPAIFSIAVEKLGLCPNQVLVVGDSIKNDILPAISLGCPTIWLKGEQWQEGPTPEANAVINDIGQVTGLLGISN